MRPGLYWRYPKDRRHKLRAQESARKVMEWSIVEKEAKRQTMAAGDVKCEAKLPEWRCLPRKGAFETLFWVSEFPGSIPSVLECPERRLIHHFVISIRSHYGAELHEQASPLRLT